MIAIITIGDGLLYHVSPQGNLEKVLKLDPNLTRFSWLVPVKRHRLNRFYLSKSSIKFHNLIRDLFRPI